MNTVKELVYDALIEVMSDNDIEIEIDEDVELSRDTGIDSMGIVTLVVLLEEKFEVELDDYLSEVRNCKTVKNLVELMEKVKSKEV